MQRAQPLRRTDAAPAAPSPAPPRPGGRSPAVLTLVALCTLVELVLVAADLGLVGSARWRGLAYQYGAFWAGLLQDWRPNFPLQPWTMFATYPFLHGGLWHLAGNMLTLLALGGIVTERAGQARFLTIYATAAVGGGLAFGLLGPEAQPMVGASGALFGLAGAWQYWEWSDRRRTGRPLWPVGRTILGLVVLNLVLWALLQGLLAWQTHLGGFLAGWLATAALAPGDEAGRGPGFDNRGGSPDGPPDRSL